MLLDSFAPADVILFLFLRTSLLPSRKRLLGNLVFSPHHLLVVRYVLLEGSLLGLLLGWAIPVFWDRASCLGSVGTPGVEPQKLNPKSVTANRSLAVQLYDLGNVDL